MQCHTQSEAIGTLTITSNRYFAMEYILPRLSQFMNENPKLQITLELAERFPNLAEEGIDILFGVSMDGSADLIRRRVATTHYICCASPSYLAAYGIPQQPSDIAQHRYITHSMRKPDNVLTFKNNKEVYVEPVLRLNDSRAIRECALQDMGIVRLHDYVVVDAIEAGQLKEVLADYRDTEKSIYLYYQANRYLQPKIRRFIDFFAENSG